MPAEITSGDIAARARGRLSFDPPARWAEIDGPSGGDHVLDGRAFFTGVPRAAAVLVGVVTHHAAPTVLLTTRLAGLRQHSGQVAFPGGKIDASDASPLAAALREAEEEVGLDRAAVTPLGFLDPYLTGTGFMVMPALCLIRPPLRLRINPAEVAERFRGAAALSHGSVEPPEGGAADHGPGPALLQHDAPGSRRVGRHGGHAAQPLREAVPLMGRALLDVLVPFLLPFAGYVLYLVLRRRYPFVVSAWSRGPLAALVVAGLALAVLSLLAAGFFGHRGQGDYVPAHLENGVLVPGRMR